MRINIIDRAILMNRLDHVDISPLLCKWMLVMHNRLCCTTRLVVEGRHGV